MNFRGSCESGSSRARPSAAALHALGFGLLITLVGCRDKVPEPEPPPKPAKVAEEPAPSASAEPEKPAVTELVKED